MLARLKAAIRSLVVLQGRVLALEKRISALEQSLQQRWNA
jgi:hypothetical protein